MEFEWKVKPTSTQAHLCKMCETKYTHTSEKLCGECQRWIKDQLENNEAFFQKVKTMRKLDNI